MSAVVQTRERLPDWTQNDFERFRMNQLTQIMERRFTAIEQALTDIDLTSTGIIGGDTFAPIVHSHGETEISDLGDGNFYVSLEFVESTLRLDQISDVDVTGIQNNFIIKWDAGNSKWIVDNFASAGNSISSLTDTTILNPADGDIIIFDGGTSKWINTDSDTLPYVQVAGDTMTGNLQMLDAVEVQYGDGADAIMFFDGANWTFRTLSGVDVFFDTASGSNFVINSPLANDTLLELRQNSVLRGTLQHDSSLDRIVLRNEILGGHVVIEGIDSVFGSVIRTGVVFDPDAGTELYEGGRSNSPTLRAATTPGGFDIFSADATDPATGGTVSVGIGARNANGILTWEITTSTILNIRNFIFSGHINITATSSGGSTRNVFTGDPDGLSQMYHLGAAKVRTQTLGGEVRGNANNDPTTGGVQDQVWDFVNLVAAKAGTVGFLQSTIDFLAYNRVHGGRTIMRGEATAGTIRDLVIGDPDDDIKFFDEGNEVLRTLPAASGGGEANNTLTGGGFERVLTTSDLSGAILGLNDLTDVSTAAAAPGDILYKSAGAWLNTNAIFIDPAAAVRVQFNGSDSFRTIVDGIEVVGNAASQSHLELRDSANALIGELDIDATNMLLNNHVVNGVTLIRGTVPGPTLRTMIAADPGGAVALWHNGAATISTLPVGMEVRGLLNNDPAVGGLQDSLIELSNVGQVVAGEVGFRPSTVDMAFMNRVHGGKTIIGGESDAGLARDVIEIDYSAALGFILFRSPDGTNDIMRMDAGENHIVHEADVAAGVTAEGQWAIENNVGGQTAEFGFPSIGASAIMRVKNYLHGGEIEIVGENAAGTERIFLAFDGDTSISVLRGILDNSPSGDGAAQDTVLNLANLSGLVSAQIGFQALNDQDFWIISRNEGGNVIIGGENAAGAERKFIECDPDLDVGLFHTGTEVARTLTAATGGLEANNTLSGEGFERVLTTGDILSDVRASNLVMATATLATAMTVTGLIASTTYAIECYLRFNTNATDDFQFNVEIGTDTHTGEGQWDSSDNAQSGVWTIDVAEVVNATGSEQTVHIVGRVLTDASGGSITIDVAKNGDAGADGTLNLGSWVRMIPLI